MLDLIITGALLVSPETGAQDRQQETAQPSATVVRNDIESEYVYRLTREDAQSTQVETEGDVVIITVVDGRTQRIVRQGVQYDPEQSGLDH